MSPPPEHMTICEVGPRDGLQNLKRLFSVDERIELINRLSSTGVRRIEAVSFANPKRVPQMAGAEEVLAGIDRPPGVEFAGLVMNERGAGRALATNLQEIRIVVVASETFSQRNQAASVEQAIDVFRRVAGDVKSSGRRLTGVIAAAFGCPFEGSVAPELVAGITSQLVEAGADEIILADTIGVGVPTQVETLFELTRARIGDIPIGFHFHNTRNTGLANAYAGWRCGAVILDSSIGGLGGCPFAPAATGNIATEDLVHMLRNMNVAVDPDLKQLIEHVGWLRRLVPDDIAGQLADAGAFPESAHA